MSSPPLLDFGALAAPMAGELPAGTPVPFEVRDKLEKSRKEEDPADFAADDPRRPAQATHADWPGIIRLAQETLTQTSKDLMVAARLTEALVRREGSAGLRDGLHLLRLLVADCWERVHPELEDPPDPEVRAAPFYWLDDSDRGARFPSTVRSIPLIVGADAQFDWQQWRKAQGPKGAANEALTKAIQETPLERCQSVVADLTQAQTELAELTKALTVRLGQAAPGLMNVKQAVEDCLTLARQVLQHKSPAAAAPETNGAAHAPAAANGAASAPPRAADTRQEVYQQLAQAAHRLRQLEPHSPIPYLIERAVQLGALSFPEMIRALIREPNVLNELSRELGIPKEAAAK